jgi:type VI secretion system secreted protein VgrG
MAGVRVGVAATAKIAGEEYRVLAYALREAIFEVGGVSCTIVRDDKEAPDPKALIGKDCEIVLERTDHSQKRSFAGLVMEAVRYPSEDDIQQVDIRVVPKMWRLGKRADCRTFQKMAVPDIVKKVLKDAGVPDDHTEWKTTGSYPKRDYTVQYRETDLEFAMRLCSEEGIYFAIHHQDDKDKVVFGDDPKGFADVSGKTSLTYRDNFGEHEDADQVMRVEQAIQVRSDKVMLRDYDPNKPKLKLESKAEGTDAGSHDLEVYVYPGRFTDKAVGDRYAKVLLESLQADRNLVSGEVGCLTLAPGLRFSIEEHPYAALNQEYMVVAVEISGRDERHGHAIETSGDDGYSYRCAFRAVPTKTTKYAPPRVQRERYVPELQTALTTGPSGEEIYTNEHGQVKAQFWWDRLGKKDENASVWMRTSQLPTGGSMLLPRMKWEVCVRYNEGDVDQPVVMARMYNGATPPPYALPANKARGAVQTATTPGGGSTNEFRTDDTKGKEEMFFNASKDMSVDVLNNTTEQVGNNQKRQVGSNHSLSVTNSVENKVGSNQKITVGANQDIHVQTFYVDQVGGSYSLTVGGNRSMHIGGDHKRDVGGDSTVKIDGNMIDLIVGSQTDDTLANFTHKVAAANIAITAGSRSITVGGARAETTGAVKLIGSLAGVGTDTSGSMMHKVAGAILTKIAGDRSDGSSANYTEIAAGAHIIKATNVMFEAETMLSLVMGASTITLLPALVAIAGVSMKLDGAATDTGALVVDN